MTEDLVVEILSEVFYTSFTILLPVLGVSMVIGLIISVFQATTSIQEMTLTFVPKILATGITIILLLPWMMDKIITLTNRIFNIMVDVVR